MINFEKISDIFEQNSSAKNDRSLYFQKISDKELKQNEIDCRKISESIKSFHVLYDKKTILFKITGSESESKKGDLKSSIITYFLNTLDLRLEFKELNANDLLLCCEFSNHHLNVFKIATHDSKDDLTELFETRTGLLPYNIGDRLFLKGYIFQFAIMESLLKDSETIINKNAVESSKLESKNIDYDWRKIYSSSEVKLNVQLKSTQSDFYFDIFFFIGDLRL
jgi:hypothetical protein